MDRKRLEQHIQGFVCSRCGGELEVWNVDGMPAVVCPQESRCEPGVTRQVFDLAQEYMKRCGKPVTIMKENDEDFIREKRRNSEVICSILRWGKDNWPDPPTTYTEGYFVDIPGDVEDEKLLRTLVLRAGSQRMSTCNHRDDLTAQWVITWYGDYETNRKLERLIQKHYVTGGRSAPEIQRRTW